MFAGSTRAPLQIHVGMGIEKACASVLGPNLVEVRLGGGICGCTMQQWKDSFRVRGSARWQEKLATCGLDSLKERV